LIGPRDESSYSAAATQSRSAQPLLSNG